MENLNVCVDDEQVVQKQGCCSGGLCREEGEAERGSRRRNVDGTARVRGNNRRAELLDYAKHLRSPATVTAPQSPPPSHIKQKQALGADGGRKQNNLSTPTCSNKWSFVVTRFLGCMRGPKTTKDKKKKNHKSNVKALIHSFQTKKRGASYQNCLQRCRNDVRKDSSRVVCCLHRGEGDLPANKLSTADLRVILKI
ncbi:uncharacterized protein LOC125218270 [Salvia hispanica]|uniref:uncharacterized protein LOC125218270 n=1 Tax=Salvia hispanica TaxID=49212 RepID=UPI002009B1A5|nr:uncharacterized protein LOC125218270 [Salvia hispanica]